MLVRSFTVLLALVSACKEGPTTSEPVPLQTCPELLTGGEPILTEADLQVLVDSVRLNLFPELDGVPLTLQTNTSDSSYFSANLNLTTLEEPPRERSYFLNYSTVQFDDPPPVDAVTAILAHELKHVRDYTEMNTDEFVAFGIAYATEPISAYERQTDEHALELDCGEGLILFREWLYAHVTPEVEAQKRIDYYTPEEIQVWIDTH